MKKFVLTIFVLFFISNFLIAQFKTKNVFIVVIDGARYTETFGSEGQYIPKIWNQLRPKGTIYTSFYIDADVIKAKTNPGHASIVTGTWQNVDNSGSNRPEKPTLFEYFRKQHNSSLTDNYVIVGKNKLDILSYSRHSEYGRDYRASVKKATQYDDQSVWEHTKQIIASNHPKLVIINLPEVDIAGHLRGWDEYILALKQADTIVYELWNLIQSDSVYKNQTTMFVTNDHGRHTNDFTGHGDNCEGCRHLMLLVIGPDTPAGIIDEEQYKLIDIAPTIGHLLNFETSYCTGNKIDTAFLDTSIQNLSLTSTIPQSYPNPFNPECYIPVNAKCKMKNVKCKIYNILGQLVREIECSRVQGLKGSRIYWDGRDGRGLEVPAGVYFYEVEGEAVRKMIVLK
jgi:hypothetical protein